ncbi:GNAT family N-acetyltransferase [Pedosphaera parvula]|uniref:GCN5-related N-acetyltransferase n=1 Tax=Pedosphaera parvula (strain Ellin514) TaxID=320771 RepID=B9XAN8_PEDPL|nr:GNAT family N-acetyltransferase [Pedosphaera parvula]EEF63073.1 GCN5-related N-acetyltransferase [Pedosphaera parvula Ellin514]
MEHFHIRDSREVPDALRQLYESYRASLPPFKQEFVGKAFPSLLLAGSGIICFQNNLPAAALTWNVSPTVPGLVTAEFYFEQTWAAGNAVELLIAEYLKAVPQSNSHCVELWISPGAKIHQVLLGEGFQQMERQLLELTSKAPEASCPQGVNFIRLDNFHITPASLQELSELLFKAYWNTVDGVFFEHYRTPAFCQQYVSKFVESPYCDVRNSWIACLGADNRAVGMALGCVWPKARALYLEQLAVHPSFCGHGFGRELFRRFSSVIGAGGARRIILTVSKDNSIPSTMYRSMGARFLDMEIAYFKKATTVHFCKKTEAPFSRRRGCETDQPV